MFPLTLYAEVLGQTLFEKERQCFLKFELKIKVLNRLPDCCPATAVPICLPKWLHLKALENYHLIGNPKR